MAQSWSWYEHVEVNVQGLLLNNTITQEQRKLPLRGLFYGIGHRPNSVLVKDQVELDEAGYVKVFDGVSTSCEGVFAAGDIQDTEWRQAITAAGSGCMAAIQAEVCPLLLSTWWFNYSMLYMISKCFCCSQYIRHVNNHMCSSVKMMFI